MSPLAAQRGGRGSSLADRPAPVAPCAGLCSRAIAAARDFSSFSRVCLTLDPRSLHAADLLADARRQQRDRHDRRQFLPL